MKRKKLRMKHKNVEKNKVDLKKTRNNQIWVKVKYNELKMKIIENSRFHCWFLGNETRP